MTCIVTTVRVSEGGVRNRPIRLLGSADDTVIHLERQ